MAYTCEAALGSRLITRTILSTDDEDIASVGRQWGVEVPFLRPLELARDETPALPVAHHAVSWLREHTGWAADVLVLLQPTSPLRTAANIDEALELLLAGMADTVVSVLEVPHRFNPYSVMHLRDGKLEHFWQEELRFDRYRRQELPKFYARNGPAVLACYTKVLNEHLSFYGPHVLPYEMDPLASIDIDVPSDLEIAECLLTRRGKNQ